MKNWWNYCFYFSLLIFGFALGCFLYSIRNLRASKLVGLRISSFISAIWCVYQVFPKIPYILASFWVLLKRPIHWRFHYQDISREQLLHFRLALEQSLYQLVWNFEFKKKFLGDFTHPNSMGGRSTSS